ncbi:MAG: glycine cleavage system aminomethyltransferase GcvT [Phycisphaerales bacterium]|nr:glycine cleavage system aminomethyltransferase GcvT [Phycisphaerales bacterium]
MTNTQNLLTTPFRKYHTSNHAKMVDFAGWEMPLHYGSIIDEHNQVRKSGGLFDVSHMGRLRFSGRDSAKFLDRICTRQIQGMKDGQIRYSLVCNENGGCRDDVLVYKIKNSEYLMVCNGSNREKILSHIEDNRSNYVFKIRDETQSTAMIAVQGPKVMDLLSNFSSEIPELKRYRFTTKNLLIAKILISRTGYTGEDGVEIILPSTFAQKAIDLMLKNVDEDTTVLPIGLGARDSLRLEAGMPLYGHELTEKIDPISAGLSFAVKLDKGVGENEAEQFIGQDSLRQISEKGSSTKLIGLKLNGRRSPRQDMSVLDKGIVVGEITSGCLSHTLGYPIAMAYVSSDVNSDSVEIDFGKEQLPATKADLPFIKK